MGIMESNPSGNFLMAKIGQNNPISKTTFDTDYTTYCPEIVPYNGPMQPDNSGVAEAYIPPIDITLSSGGTWNGSDIPVPYDNGLNDAQSVLKALNDIVFDYDVVPNLYTVVNDLTDIILHPYQMSDTVITVTTVLDEENQPITIIDTSVVIITDAEALSTVLMYSYHLVKESIARAHSLSLYVLEDSFQLLHTVAAQTISLIDAVLSLAAGGHFYWSGLQFELLTDKTNIQRFVYDLDNAYITLNTANNFITYPYQQNIFDRLACVLDAETAIRDGLTRPENIEADFPCLFESSALAYSQSPVTSGLSPAPATPIQKENVLVYPNPSTGEVFIKLPQGINSATYTVCNTTGTTVLSRTLKSNNSRVEMQNLPSGVYIVQIKSSAEVFNVKLVLQ